MDEIILCNVGDKQSKKLPRGIKLMILGDQAMFVKKSGKYMLPVSNEEQERLRKKYCVD